MDILKSAFRQLRAHAAFSALIILLLALGLTLASGKLLSSLLTGVTALDPLVIAAGVAGLAVVGLIACLLPARRATRVNPVDALRSE